MPPPPDQPDLPKRPLPLVRFNPMEIIRFWQLRDRLATENSNIALLGTDLKVGHNLYAQLQNSFLRAHWAAYKKSNLNPERPPPPINADTPMDKVGGRRAVEADVLDLVLECTLNTPVVGHDQSTYVCEDHQHVGTQKTEEHDYRWTTSRLFLI